MKYIDGFRNSGAAKTICASLKSVAGELDSRGRTVRVMEVCGTHTMAIARYGIRSLLPANVELISGPGCPVCVTDGGYVDAAIELAKQGVIIVTFGDMLKVPGAESNLDQCRAEGASVQICYSPLEALGLAEGAPDREVVFLAVGFETTIGPVVSVVEQAILNNITNISLLTAFKVIPPAMSLLASDPDVQIDAFLCPAHVSAIIGARAYEPLVEQFGLPCVVAGFEPLDILLGLQGILEQLSRNEARVENQYSRVVKPEGNVKARALIEKYLMPVDATWRGVGAVPKSGLGLRPVYGEYDAERRHGIEIKAGKPDGACRCGEVLKGMVKPPECALFGRKCTPNHPIGPCMVSSEGSCSAYYKYAGTEAL